VIIQKYLRILSPEDKEKLQRIHMRLEHIKNLNITFDQIKTNMKYEVEVDCEKELQEQS